MATVLFAWELGAGFGHLQRLRPVAEELLRRGHQVFAALRDVPRAGSVFCHMDVKLLQAPQKLRPPQNEFKPPLTFPHILHNTGFCDETEIAALAGAWRNLLELVRPDVVVFDHSPMALLGSRGLRLKRVLIGTGFCCPPDQYPMPNLRPWSADRDGAGAAPDKLRDDEDRELDRLNRVLDRWHQPPLERIGRLYSDVDDVLLTTFAELDHYAERPNPVPRYRGVYNRAAGRAPHWPAGRGERIFAYLKPFQGLDQMLECLRDVRYPTLVFSDGVDRTTQDRFRCPTIRFEAEKLDLAIVSRECDVAITNGNHGTTTALLLAGKPVLHVPLFLEQVLLAKRVAAMGAGTYLPPGQPELTGQRLSLLLRSPNIRRSAAAFATRYAGFDAGAENVRMAEDVERVSN